MEENEGKRERKKMGKVDRGGREKERKRNEERRRREEKRKRRKSERGVERGTKGKRGKETGRRCDEERNPYFSMSATSSSDAEFKGKTPAFSTHRMYPFLQFALCHIDKLEAIKKRKSQPRPM